MKIDQLSSGPPRGAQAVQRPAKLIPLFGGPKDQLLDLRPPATEVEFLERQLEPLGYRVRPEEVGGMRVTAIGRGGDAVYLLAAPDDSNASSLARAGAEFGAARRVFVASDVGLPPSLKLAVSQWENDGVMVEPLRWDDLAGYEGAQLAGLLRLPPVGKRRAVAGRERVFVSCHPEDAAWRELIRKFFHPLRPNVWDSTDVDTGANRPQAIADAIATTKVAVVLVTHNYLADDVLMDTEYKPFLDARDRKEIDFVWVAVSAAAYDLYELGPIKPFNDVKTPLEALQATAPHLLNAKLVELTYLVRERLARTNNGEERR